MQDVEKALADGQPEACRVWTSIGHWGRGSEDSFGR